MSKVTTKAVAKVAAVATGLAMATSMLSLAPIAHAACSVGTTNLTVGSTGAAVTCLQQTLIASGYSIPAGATGYFGMQTKAAVAAWQAAVGVSPAAGYFGPISRAALGGSTVSTGGTSTVNGCAPGAMFSSTTGQSCATVSVAGCGPGAMFSSTTGLSCSSSGTSGLMGAGRLINVNYLGDVTTDIKEGYPATSVIGVSADAVSGDVAIQRVDATFTIGSAGSQSSSLDQYISDASVYLGDTKLASMSPASGDKSGRVWTLRFSGLSGVIKQGTTGNIHVKVTPLTSIGTTEDGKTITAALLTGSVRAVGADGISDTYVVRVASNDQAFTVSSATTGTLTVSAGADNPKASQVAVSSSTTTGVKLLTFTLKAKNQDVKVTDLAIQLSTTDNNLNDVVNTVYLMQGSTVLSSKTVSTGFFGTTTFTSINRTIKRDVTENYWLAVDLKGDSSYSDGITLTASTSILGWDVSDSGGASVTPSASAQGNAMTLTATGISVVRGTPTTVTTTGLAGGADITQYTIPFTVTAGDTTVFIGSGTQIGAASTFAGVRFGTTTTSTQGATQQPTASFTAADSISGDVAGTAFVVNANTSRTFTFNAAITASSTTSGVTSGFTGVQINSIGFGPTSAAGTAYTSNLDTFKTNDVFMTKR